MNFTDIDELYKGAIEFKGVGEFNGKYFPVFIRPGKSGITPSRKTFAYKASAQIYAGELIAKAESIFGKDIFI